MIQHCGIVLCDVFQAIKTDVVRSLCTRCELLAEDLELTDETSGETLEVTSQPLLVKWQLLS